MSSSRSLAQKPVSVERVGQTPPAETRTSICFAKLEWGMNMSAAMRSLKDSGYTVPQLDNPDADLPQDMFTIPATLMSRTVNIGCYFGTDDERQLGLQKVEITFMGGTEEENKKAFRDFKEVLTKKYGAASIANLRQDPRPGVPLQQALWKTPRAFGDVVPPETFVLELLIARGEPLRINYFGPKWPALKKQRDVGAQKKEQKALKDL